MEDLQSQVKHLGGKLEREKAASPPPMPDMALSLTVTNDYAHQSKPSLEKENVMLKQRMKLMQDEVQIVYILSADVRRCCASLHALSTVPIGSINEDILAT